MIFKYHPFSHVDTTGQHLLSHRIVPGAPYGTGVTYAPLPHLARTSKAFYDLTRERAIAEFDRHVHIGHGRSGDWHEAYIGVVPYNTKEIHQIPRVIFHLVQGTNITFALFYKLAIIFAESPFFKPYLTSPGSGIANQWKMRRNFHWQAPAWWVTPPAFVTTDVPYISPNYTAWSDAEINATYDMLLYMQELGQRHAIEHGGQGSRLMLAHRIWDDMWAEVDNRWTRAHPPPQGVPGNNGLWFLADIIGHGHYRARLTRAMLI